MKKNNKIIITCIVLLIVAVGILFFWGNKDSIKIGVIADLSSRKSQLGIAGRNGVISAVEEINSTGGIDGRSIELVIVDNHDNKQLVEIKVNELLAKDVNVIIGPYTSRMGVAVANAVKGKNLLIISPTVSTNKLSSIDDNFIRVMPHAQYQGELLANSVAKQQIKSISIIRDSKNSEYTETVAKGFILHAQKLKIGVLHDIEFKVQDEFQSIINSISNNPTDAILFITSGIDAGSLAQLYSQKNTNSNMPQLFGSMWTKVTKVNRYGGAAVEGMVLLDAYANAVPGQREKDFNSKYSKRFGTTPNMITRFSYEAVQIFAEAYKRTKSSDAKILKKAILEIDPVIGITDKYSFDKYGDVNRNMSLFIVKNHEYELFSN